MSLLVRIVTLSRIFSEIKENLNCLELNSWFNDYVLQNEIARAQNEENFSAIIKNKH